MLHPWLNIKIMLNKKNILNEFSLISLSEILAEA